MLDTLLMNSLLKDIAQFVSKVTFDKALIFIFAKNKQYMKTKRTNRWVFIPVILSYLILAAHFSRNDQFILLIIAVGIPVFLSVKQLWARYIVQAGLILGAFEWASSTLDYIDIRKAMGEDYQRLAIILFSVAAFTLISGLLLYLVKPRKA